MEKYEGCFVAEAFDGNTQAGFCNGSIYDRCSSCPYHISNKTKSVVRKMWEEGL